ncbi:MAG: 1-phosphofructokinase family hexose kinase [Aggregatilineales bacterium]
MIVTLTANTTMDQTLFVPTFDKGNTIRASRTIQSMGGKPTDASFILGRLGMPSLALGFAAGVIGAQVTAMLQAQGVTVDFTPVDGETRINTVIIAEDDHSHTTITTSTLEVTEEHIGALEMRLREALTGASCLVIGGTLPHNVPPTFYGAMIGMAKEANVPVIFDADEPNLSTGLAVAPDFIKPNRHELGRLIGRTVNSLEDALHAGREICDTHGTSVIASLDRDGALAILPDRAYRIPPLKVEVVSAAGAGDAILAGIAASIERGQPIEDGLRLGFATAAAVLLQPGTAMCNREDVERLLPQVELIAV